MTAKPKRRLTVGDFDWIQEGLSELLPRLINAHFAMAASVLASPDDKKARSAWRMMSLRLREMKELVAEFEKKVKHYD